MFSVRGNSKYVHCAEDCLRRCERWNSVKCILLDVIGHCPAQTSPLPLSDHQWKEDVESEEEVAVVCGFID